MYRTLATATTAITEAPILVSSIAIQKTRKGKDRVMKMLNGVKVTTDKKVIAVLNVEQFDSWEEAKARLGEDAALNCINVQYKTNQMNEARQKASGTPPTRQLQAEAMQRIFTDPALLQKMQDLNAGVATAPDEIQKNAAQAAVTKFLTDLTETIKGEYEAKRKASQDKLNAENGGNSSEGDDE